MPHDLDAATDAVGVIQRSSSGVQSRKARTAPEFNHEALVRIALELQTTIGVQVIRGDRRRDDMDDIGVIEHALGSEFLASNHHAIDRVSAQAVASNQGTLIGQVFAGGSQIPGLSSGVIDLLNRQRIDIDADGRTSVIAESVVEDLRLCTANKNCRGIVRAATESIRIACVSLVSSSVKLYKRIR